MFFVDWVKRFFFGAKDRVPLDPDRVDELDLSKWGMGEIPQEVEGMGIAEAQLKARMERGGYGGVCIPGDDLPDSIPRTGEPPTMALKNSIGAGQMRRGPAIDATTGQNLLVNDDFAYTHLAGVKNPANTKSASITNGYERDILLKSPVLTLFLKKGETRTIRGPIFQRVPRFGGNTKYNPAAFDIVGHAAIDILKDMAAERTRSILRGQDGTGNVDQITVGRLLELSKFVVVELPDDQQAQRDVLSAGTSAGETFQNEGRKDGDEGTPPVY